MTILKSELDHRKFYISFLSYLYPDSSGDKPGYFREVQMRKLILLILLLVFTAPMEAQQYRLGDHELFFMPTAETMPKDSSYFAVHELFVLNYTYAVTGRTHVSALMVFPITTDAIRTFSIGVKQNYFRSQYFQGAVFGTFIFESDTYSIGNVFSFGNDNIDGHIGIGIVNKLSDSSTSNVIISMAGIKARVSEKISIIAECDYFEDTDGLIAIGIRFTGKSIFFDFAGFRSIKDAPDRLLFYPFVKASYMF